jgi:tetratricopeptide (TPR) repeat protein
LLAFLLISGAIFYGIYWARKNNKPLISQCIHALVFLLIGYSSFVVLAIRSNANTPIDENNPEDAMSLLSYYNRDQYGDWPILFGQSFNSQLDSKRPYTDGPPAYAFSSETGEYEVTNDGKASKPNYSKNDIGFFPRMWSDQNNHVQNYQKLMDVKTGDKIEFKDHFRFFIDYQVGQMWFRYFMWNFSGRQNDDQNRYELSKGNWITGISFIDEMRLGPQTNLPDHFLSNPSRNVYFGLPLILGLLGLYFQAKRDKKNAWVVTLLFLFTGLAIVVYTNHKPFEPRERDYAFVGSFYVFAIWIGMGVIALFEWLGKHRSTLSAAAITVISLSIPALMASQNWDDHDRSDRYTAREIAKMYLNSCEPNAILFTNGDNDTFPLWYIQEVEGYRTDVRIVNLSLLNTDWYIDMMKRKFYEGEAVPLTFVKKDYVQGTRDVLYYQDLKISGRWYAKDFLKYALRNDEGVFFTAFPNTQSPKKLQFFPMKNLRIPVDKNKVIANKVVEASDSSKIVDYIDWNWNSNVISKRDLMLIDLIANNDWSRPIYFSTTVGSSASSFFWLQKYFRLEGLAYRFVPVSTEGSGNQFDFGSVNADKMMSIMYNPEGDENKFNFGNMEKPDVFLDETVRRSTFNLRINYGRLASELSNRGRNEEALKVLDFAMEKMPVSKLGYDYFFLNLIEGYYKAGDKEKAKNYIDEFSKVMENELRFYAQFKGADKRAVKNEIQTDLQFMQMLARMLMQYEYNNSPLTQEEYNNVELIQLYEELAELCG